MQQTTVLLLFMFVALARGQSITEISFKHLRDEIPSHIAHGTLRFVKLLPSWTSIEAHYSFHAMSLDNAYGLSARSLQLHSVHVMYSLTLFDNRLFLTGGPRLDYRTGGESKLAPGYTVTIKGALFPSNENMTFQTMLAVDKTYYPAGVLSIDQNILCDRIHLNLSGELHHVVSIAVNGERNFLSDRNVIDNFYAYAFLYILQVPDIRIGYGFQYANAREDHWTSTATVPDQTTGLYTYTYFYVPYFTPLQERGHLALAHIRWAPAAWMAMRLRVSVPVSSRSDRAWTPPFGENILPPPLTIQYEEHKVLQTTFSLSLEFELSSTRWLAVELERFTKPYYSYSQVQAKLTMTY